ncbi:MAG: bifunctional 4'-phosphopantothenoylcysteine decarboxylase/phosphopantothenoylcysteine synthetase, partial [Armatimonadetes bacterium]|nr:bifunctional 4'-phosphopantothenoylcysteine decarboxylase/phosphopantothenoylcysteine synthetase [Armatimonadota bacterium]
DILEELGKNKKDKILIGFALETKNLINNAKSKLKNKNLDLIIANPLKEGISGFNSNTNLAVLIYKNGKEEKLSLMNKKELADLILDKLVFLLKDKA